MLESVAIEYKPKNEIDIYSYSAFTLDKWFPAEHQLYNNNVEKLSGERLLDFHSIINHSLIILNKNNTENRYQLKDFEIGYYRVTPVNGYEYDLFFKIKSDCCSMISLNKPIQEIRINSLKFLSDEKPKVINFIIPLWFDKLSSLRIFLNIFESTSIKQDNSFSTLNFVYLYDNHDENQIILKNITKKMILKFQAKTNFEEIRFIVVVTKIFSRAKALQIGVDLCCSNYDKNEIEINIDESLIKSRSTDYDESSLLFFCDIDILYTIQFLNLCRFNAVKLEKVYYPILYSFYNPKIVNKYSNISITLTNLTISKDTGFFRDFGFGMSCQYKKDFLDINGFKDLPRVYSQGWGDEDLFLYKKYIKNSSVKIMRQITPSLIHYYHEKECNIKKMNNLQYKHCLESKVFNEASHRHFGFFYFNYTF